MKRFICIVMVVTVVPLQAYRSLNNRSGQPVTATYSYRVNPQLNKTVTLALGASEGVPDERGMWPIIKVWLSKDPSVSVRRQPDHRLGGDVNIIKSGNSINLVWENDWD